jgi:hypothetical protein
MNSNTRQYLYGLIFFGVGIYFLTKQHWLDASLFSIAGLAFIANTLASEARLLAYKKELIIVAWVLIILTGLVFLYWLQFKFL